MKPIFCFGDICPDIIIPYGAARYPSPDKALNPADLEVTAMCGGSVANTAVGIARQGFSVYFCGTAGCDGFGRMLKADLEREGVDTRYMELSASTSTVLVLIVLDENGERTTFAYPKAKASQHQITAAQIPKEIEKHISWFHSTGMTLRENPAAELQLELMKRCFSAGIPTSFDVNTRVEALGDPLFFENLKKALPYCNYLLGSADGELAAISGIDDPDRAARQLSSCGRVVVARHGEKGATAYKDGEVFTAPSFKVEVLDTVGAGDAYNAGFICAILSGLSIEDANRWAVATGAYSVTRRGGHGAPTRAQLQEFLNG
ncbi:MAG: carbohydrate kinase family protein [Clostridia bacterium]|nr:carbohydrate kinase family protein [Clostridia bacterium]